MVTDDILKLKDKLLEDASKIKVCRNCKLCYIREDQEHGYCKYIGWERPPEIPLVVHEYYVCDHWRSKDEKEEKKED